MPNSSWHEISSSGLQIVFSIMLDAIKCVVSFIGAPSCAGLTAILHPRSRVKQQFSNRT